jgi:hypothetical protein
MRALTSPKFGGDPRVERAWEISLDGCNEEIGSVTENGHWVGLIIDAHVSPRGKHVVVTEDELGFVDAEFFESEDDARRAFDDWTIQICVHEGEEE